MPDENREHGNEEHDAPLRLIEGLRRLPQPVVLVPPQIDAAALSRPRLHLARVREMQGQGTESGAFRLALAAHSGEAGAAPTGQLSPHAQTSVWRTPTAWWNLAWRVLALAALLAAVIWLAREWRGHGGFEPAVKPQQTIKP